MKLYATILLATFALLVASILASKSKPLPNWRVSQSFAYLACPPSFILFYPSHRLTQAATPILRRRAALALVSISRVIGRFCQPLNLQTQISLSLLLLCRQFKQQAQAWAQKKVMVETAFLKGNLFLMSGSFDTCKIASGSYSWNNFRVVNRGANTNHQDAAQDNILYTIDLSNCALVGTRLRILTKQINTAGRNCISTGQVVGWLASQREATGDLRVHNLPDVPSNHIFLVGMSGHIIALVCIQIAC